MIVFTAAAMASGSLSAATPLPAVTIGERRRSRGDGGRAAGERFQGGQPERLVRPRSQRDVCGREDRRDGVATADEPDEVDGQPDCLALQLGPQRTIPHDDEPGIHTRITKHRKRIDAAVGVLLDGQPSAVNEQRLRSGGPSAAYVRRAQARVELVQVDAEGDGDDVRSSDALELRARERGRTHHGVVVGRSCEIITVATSCARPHGPSDRRVNRSETSNASGASSVSRAVIGRGDTAR
jgi:hypothetical protein